MTVLDVIQRSQAFLARKGIDAPRLQVELLLAHLLNVPRLRLYLDFQRELAEPELAALRELVKRRGNREPLQHLVGTVSFCGLELKVDRRVLVPRPETEVLAECAWTFIADWPPAAAGPLTVLDFGTGSGCLAITLAVKLPGARVVASDLSETALEVARANAERQGVAHQIEWFAGDGLQAVPDGLHFDLVVSNPPYVPTPEIESLQPEVRDHDPRMALDGGTDGLDFYRRLAEELPARMKTGGHFMAEFGDGQERRVREIFEAQNWIVEAIRVDYAGRPRIVVASRESRFAGET